MHSLTIPRAVGKLLTGVAAIAICAVAFQPTGAVAQTFKMKIGYATINDPQHEMGVRIGELVKKRSNGRITYQTFPASQLGKIPRQVEGIQLGTQEVFLTPPGFLVGLNPGFQVPDAPGLYSSLEHGHKALTDPSFRDKFLSQADNKGVYGANIWLYDGTSIASVKPIRKPEDIAGRKIRVLATPMERAVPAQFGGTGVPIPYTEVVPALQRGVVDGCRSSLVVMGYSKFFSVTKYITVLNGGYIPTGTWISKVWLNKLPADLRKIVMEVPKELENWGSKNAAANFSVVEKLWKDNGAEVIRFSPQDQARYMGKLQGLGDKFLASHKDKRVRDMYALFKASVEKHRPKTN